MNRSAHFRLYAHNLAVAGATRSAIYDLQRQNIVLIPSVLHKLLRHLAQHPWRETRQVFAAGCPQVFEQYVDFLLQKDLGFFTDAPDCFPALGLEWHSPHLVQNAVVHYAFGQYSLLDVLGQLDALHCQHLELRLDLGAHPWAAAVALFEPLEAMAFQSVTLLLAHAAGLPDEAGLAEFYERFPKIQHLLVHTAPRARPSTTHPGRIAFVQHDLLAEPPRDRYVVNSDYFTEALRFNPYYHRKLCVSAAGDLKNCLRHAASFGNVRDTPLATVLADPAFQVLWHAAPDHTAGLRDSELRYAHFSADYLVRDPASGLFTRQPLVGAGARQVAFA